MRRAVLLALCPALALAACAGGGGTSTTGNTPGHPGAGAGASAPVRDTFTGTVVTGTGAYSGRSGRVTIYLHPRGSGQSRQLRVVLRGECDSSGKCVDLQGTATGTLVSGPRGLPDTGHDYTLTASGQVAPLGRVTIHGGVVGTGFISRGQELIRVRLTASSGSVTVVARTGRVKGFTSP